MIAITSSLSNRQIRRAFILLFKAISPVQVCEMLADAAKAAANELPLSKGTPLALFSQRMLAFAKSEEETELRNFLIQSAIDANPSELKPTVFLPKPTKHLDFGKTIREPVSLVDEEEIATDPFIFLAAKPQPLCRMPDRR
jgi:hypothetical protein